MIDIDSDMLLNDLYNTANKLNRSNSKYFFNNNYPGFDEINDILLDNYGIYIMLNSFENRKKLEEDLDKEEDKSICDFVNLALYNKDIFVNISRHFLRYLRKIRFKNLSYYNNINVYNEKDFKDIILGFYSTISDDYYKVAKKYFDEGRIKLPVVCGDKELIGFFSNLTWLKSGYIFSRYYEYNTAAACNIVHELGHAIDFEKFIAPQQKYIPAYSDLLLEFPSETMDTIFKDYLISEHIDIDGSLILKNEDICYLKKCTKVLRDNLSKDESSIINKVFDDIEESIKIEEEVEEIDIDKEKKEKLPYLRDSILYGIGIYFGYHLNMIRKSSNKVFLKIYNNIMTLRKEATLDDIIAYTGINKEDFITGKCIKPMIEDDYMKLKKRFKID